jgi:hypothetical protein
LFGRPERASIRRYVLVATSAALAVAASLLLAGAVGAGSDASTSDGVSARPITAGASGPTVVDVTSLPRVRARSGGHSHTLPFRSPLGKRLALAKKNAAAAAPTAEGPILQRPTRGPRTPDTTLVAGFDGMADSDTICAPGGCQPSDQGIASNGNMVVQMVNTSIDVYDTSGVEQSGFPKSLQDFFGVPDATCDALTGPIPFLADPRLLYDPADHRFIAAALQIQGVWGIAGDPSLGGGNNCPPTSLYWVAVSQTDDPTGAWNVYSIDTEMDVGFGNGFADYTQLGFNGEGIFIGGNLFDESGFFFVGSFVLALPKKDMESNNSIDPPNGFGGFVANDTLLDTVHPVATYGAGDGGPPGEFLISSFNPDSGKNAKGVVVFDFSNALGGPSVTPGTCVSGQQCLTWVVAKTAKYSQPPLAGQGAHCSQCLETIDTRISATPVYLHGNLYFTHDTAAKVKTNGINFVNANVLWGIIRPVLDQNAVPGCPGCSVITTKTIRLDEGTITFPGQTDTWFGAIQPDREGNLFLGFDYQTTNLNGPPTFPSSAYIARRATAQPGSGFPDTGVILFGDDYFDPSDCTDPFSPDFPCRWGDYSAIGFDGWGSNGIWFATQYGNSSHEWSTRIDELGYTTLAQK